MEAYLDNAATTRTYSAVREIMMETLDLAYGNPSSMHQKGLEAENYVKAAGEIIAKSMKVDSKEICFTSGGTESNNLALIGTAHAMQRSGKHIITTCMEHASVYNPLIFLEENGFRITYLSVDQYGHVKEEELANAICEDTILVSIMYVNNEIGAVQDIARLSQIIKEKNKNTIFHVDAIQAYGKYKIYPKRMGIDLLSVSGHKIHGPKGSGFLYVRDKVKIKPIIFGGGQQKDLRSGTENVPGIAGIAKAAEEIYTNHEAKVEHLYKLKNRLICGVMQRIEKVTVQGIDALDLEGVHGLKTTAPHVTSISFAGIKSEVLLHALEEKGVYVSAGSACSSNHPAISGTLKAIGVSRELLDSTLRFSMSVQTTEQEVDYAIEELEKLVPQLRKYHHH